MEFLQLMRGVEGWGDVIYKRALMLKIFDETRNLAGLIDQNEETAHAQSRLKLESPAAATDSS